MKAINTLFIAALLSLSATSGSYAAFNPETQAAVSSAVEGEHRSAKNKARDPFRKPEAVLDFLGFRSDMTVVEVWPGGGWYTEILAPALKDNGKLYAANFDPNGRYGYQKRQLASFFTKLGSHPKLFKTVEVTEFALPYKLAVAPKGSADMVVTFRNAHNWFADLYGSGKYAPLAFEAMYDALKPGGIMGIADHRWQDPETEDPLSGNGYLSEERTIKLAEAAGFELVARSELLANPKDTRNHEHGVWSLPPVYASGEKDREKYAAIGESDRYLLKFVKPKS